MALQELVELKSELRRRYLIKDALQSHFAFTQLLYPEVEGSEFLDAADARVMCKVIDRVFEGKINRLVVTLPPGYRKTVLFVIMLIARGLAINPAAKFIHTSYSDKLVNENSTKIRDVLSAPSYRQNWNRKLREDVKSKGLWRTKEGGGLLASPAGGTITGFRAGTLDKGFTGALVIDDPLKPDDAFSKVERDAINQRWHTTFKSRLADEKVPVIVVMQRLHQEDFAGYLLAGGAGCEWHHLMLPVLIEENEEYPDEFTHGIPLDHKLPPGPLWSRKHDLKQIESLKKDTYTYNAQYKQRPTAAGGALFHEEHFHEYGELPDLRHRAIWVDSAQKTQERNDYTVFLHAGLGYDGCAYLIDLVRGKFEAPELLTTAQAVWDKALAMNGPKYGVLRSMRIEDKSSGTGLIQQLKRKRIPVTAIQRTRDKYSRAMDVVPVFNVGSVLVPKNAPWVLNWKIEMIAFDGKGNAHDDQVDATIDAALELVVLKGALRMTDVVS